MGTLNEDGIRFVHQHTKPLAIDSLDAAALAIEKELMKEFKAGKSLYEVGKHLAWLIGFDALIDDRNAIHRVTSLIVESKA